MINFILIIIAFAVVFFINARENLINYLDRGHDSNDAEARLATMNIIMLACCIGLIIFHNQILSS